MQKLSNLQYQQIVQTDFLAEILQAVLADAYLNLIRSS